MSLVAWQSRREGDARVWSDRAEPVKECAIHRLSYRGDTCPCCDPVRRLKMRRPAERSPRERRDALDELLREIP